MLVLAHRFPTIRLFVVASIIITSLVSLTAQTTVYIGPSGGNWFDASNWSAGLPSSPGDALIPGGTSVVIDQNLIADFPINSFGNLTVPAGVSVSFNQPVLTQALIVEGTVQVKSNCTAQAGLNNSGSLTVESGSGALALQGTSQNSGTIVTNGILNVSGPMLHTGNLTVNGQLVNGGNWTNAPTAATIINVGGVFNNDFGSNFTLPTGTSLTVSGSFENSGSVSVSGSWISNGITRNNVVFTVSDPGTLSVNNVGQFINFGNATITGSGTVAQTASVTINPGSTLTVNGLPFNNEGTINLNGSLVVAPSTTFTNANNAAINGNFGTTIINSGTFINQGSIVTNGAIDNLAGTFNNVGTIQSNVGSTLTNASVWNNSGTLNHLNIVTNNGTLTNTGRINIQSGGQLVNNGSITNSVTGKIVSQFELINNSGATLTNNGTLIVEVRLLNSGVIENNALLDINSGRFNNNGSFNNYDLFQLTNGSFDNSTTFVNFSRFSASTCSTIKNRAGATINNQGQALISGFLSQFGSWTGTMFVLNGGYVQTTPGSATGLCVSGKFGLNAQGEAKAYAQAFVSIPAIDSCANFIYKANGVDRPVFTCAQAGTTQPISLLIITPLGDSLTCSTTAQIVDELSPEFSNCPADRFVQTTTPNVNVSWTAPTATDNCTSNPTVTVDRQPGSSFPVGISSVTYTAKDPSNVEGFCQFKVTVQQVAGTSNCSSDNAPPTFSGCPSNISVTQTGVKTPVSWTAPTASDVCYPLTVTNNFNPGALFDVGSYIVRYVATDGGNRTSTCQFTVTVNAVDPCPNDNQSPVLISCPANIYLPANVNTGTAVASWTPPVFQDECAFDVTTNIQPNSILNVGITNVTYTATDSKGNTATCVFKITVGANPCPTDNVGPSFSGCPANITQTTTGNSATATWTPPTATDACGVTINSNYKPGARFPLGQTVVYYQASDDRGNTSVCTFTVTVNNSCVGETVRPVINNCPSAQTVSTVPPATTAPASWTPPTATDNCGTPTLTTNYLPGVAFPIGITTVSYVATDLAGNTTNCTFAITVVQGTTTPPSSNCNRVTTGLLALYDFKEGSGNTVNDKSGVGTPLNLTIAHPGNVTWLAGCGLRVNSPTIISSPTAASKLSTAIKQSGAITIEAWVKPANTTQDGPARLVTMSSGTGLRNFMLAQSKSSYVARLRTSNTSQNGTPTISTPTNTLTTQLQHVVYTRGSDGQEFIYINGVQQYSGTRTGSLSGFNDSYVLALLNETSHDRAWLGEINLVAIYNQALTAAQVVQNFNAGACCNNITQCPTGGLTREYFANQTSDDFNLLNTLTPTSKNTITSGQGPSNIADNYMTRVRGWVRPTVTGTYQFGIVGDDKTYLYVSTNNSSANKVLVARIDGWTHPGEQTKYSTQRSANIQLQAGVDYYIEVNHKEFGGGDHFAIYWKTPSQDFHIIPGNNLVPFDGCTPPPPASTCPTGGLTREYFANQTSDDFNLLSTLTPTSKNTITSGQGPINIADNYMTRVRGWVRPTVSGTYQFGIVGDDKTYLYISTNNSSANKVLVARVDDWTHPGEQTKYSSQRSMAMQLQAGVDYYIEVNHKEYGGGDHFAIYWKTPSQDFHIIPGANLVPFDGCNNQPTPPQCQTGGLVREYYANVTSWDINAIFSSWANPTSTHLMTSGQGPINLADNYKQRVRGYIRPAVTGKYVIAIASDDHSRLYLSNNSNEADKQLVAFIDGWTTPTDLYKYSTQCTAELTLEAGKDYYIELHHKEGGSGDHFSIWWKTPINNNFTIIPGSNLVPFNCQWPSGLAAAIPVFDLNAAQDQRRVRLTWVNNTGPENDIFFVERLDRSTGEFNVISAVEAFASEAEARSYHAVDNTPDVGENSYRVRLVKQNGAEVVSNIASVLMGDFSAINVYPNPTSGRMWLDLTPYKDMQVQVTLYNLLGQPMFSYVVIVMDEAVEFDLSDYPVGHYRLEITADGKRPLSQPVVIGR